jgi:hypothetical protein
MDRPTLNQALTSVLGAAVPNGARLALLTAITARANERSGAVVLPFPASRQLPAVEASPVPDRPVAAA